jgi:hypothetical protein
MKKIYVGILAILYMAVSSGIAMEIHYCMGKKAGVEFYGSDSDKCGKCGMKDTKTGCCHDEHKFYKLNDSHKSVSNDINFTADETALVNDHYQYDWQVPSATSLTALNNNSPPDHAGPSASVMNCVFRL